MSRASHKKAQAHRSKKSIKERNISDLKARRGAKHIIKKKERAVRKKKKLTSQRGQSWRKEVVELGKEISQEVEEAVNTIVINVAEYIFMVVRYTINIRNRGKLEARRKARGKTK